MARRYEPDDLDAEIEAEADLLVRIDAADRTSEEMRRWIKKARAFLRKRDRRRARQAFKKATAVYDAWMAFESRFPKEEEKK